MIPARPGLWRKCRGAVARGLIEPAKVVTFTLENHGVRASASRAAVGVSRHRNLADAMSRNLSVNPPLDILLFLRAGLRRPRRLGAVAPSGRALAHLITSEIAADKGPVIELGAGTGAFTRALLRRGVPEAQLVLVEADPHFARVLETRFPAARVLAIQAQRLRHVDPLQGRAAVAVVSGLPLLSMRRREVMGVLSGAFHRLGAGGAFYQFTYGPRCPVSAAILKRLGLRAKRIGWVVNNLPPATVYRIERASARPSATQAA